MKYFLLALLCLLGVAKSYGQTGTRSYHTIVVEITKEKKPKRIFAKAEITPAFPGRDSSRIQAFEKELNQSIPFKNGAKAGTYIVSVRFLIEGGGSIVDYRCINDPGFGMCQQVMAVFAKKFPNRWLPQIDSSGKVPRWHAT